MSMQKDFLVELLTEELPPKSLLNLATHFEKEIRERLKKLNLAFAETTFFATPRRISVLVKHLDAKQSDQTIEKRGPAVNAAFDAKGEATPACLGFAKTANVPVSQLITIKTDQGEWVATRQQVKGQTVFELLPNVIDTNLF